MIPPSDVPRNEIESLGRLLDEEAALLDLRRSQLASLCAAIVDRDPEATERLLDQIERAQQLQDATDAKLDAARRALAGGFACPPGQVRLSGLIDRLPEPYRADLTWKRQQIVALIEHLQQEHMRAVVLLAECARINRLLTEALFPGSESVTTYSAAGPEAWRGCAGLVDTER